MHSSWLGPGAPDRQHSTRRPPPQARWPKEAFYIISGEFELELLDINTNEKESHTIKTGDFFVIKRNLSHSFNFTKDTNLISMYSNGVEEKDGMDIYTA